MGRLKTLAQTFREFPTNHVEEPDVPAAPGRGRVRQVHENRTSTPQGGNQQTIPEAQRLPERDAVNPRCVRP